MDAATRTALVTAAITMAGPVSEYLTKAKDQNGNDVLLPDRSKWTAAVQENALAIAAMAGPKGQIGRLLDNFENYKTFTGTVLRVDKESSSTRGFVIIHTGSTGGNNPARDLAGNNLPEGYETFRTDRTDSATGRAMALRLRDEFVGHRVIVWLELEEAGGRKYRVVRHVESLGVDRDAAQKMGALPNAA